MKTIRLLSATDLHQRKNLYGDLHQAVAKEKPDLLLLVGDFLNEDSSAPGTMSEADYRLVRADTGWFRVLSG